MPETWAQSLGWEDPLKKGKATYSTILAWRIPWCWKESDTTEQLSLHINNLGNDTQKKLEKKDIRTQHTRVNYNRILLQRRVHSWVTDWLHWQSRDYIIVGFSVSIWFSKSSHSFIHPLKYLLKKNLRCHHVPNYRIQCQCSNTCKLT